MWENNLILTERHTNGEAFPPWVLDFSKQNEDWRKPVQIKHRHLSSLIVLDLARTCGNIATSAAAQGFSPIESYVCKEKTHSGRGEVSGMHLQASLTVLVLLPKRTHFLTF